MKLPRFIACLLLFMSFVPFGAAAQSAPAGSVELASSVAREASTTANRSASRTAPLQIAAPAETTTTTTAAPVTTTVPPTTTPPTTAAPVTTTTAKPRPTTTTITVAPVVAEAAPAAVAGGGKQAVVQIALAQVGKSYVSGATGPNSFDCSGLVFYVFNQAGIKVPRLTSDGYMSAATRITRAELQPGDLIIGRGHIGIFVGNGMMVDASTPRGGVKHRSIDTVPPIAYGRL